MNRDGDSPWFPAKRYGWGWGWPNRWQGWLVVGLYVVLLSLSALSFLPHGRDAAFIACAALLTIALTIVCWIKGEKPQWRWGR